MAKLLPPYSLCPLLEPKKCLGVFEDSTPGCVIVTLGKNIVIRYRLSDQKQVSSWSSKDKLSAPVIFDFHSKHYVAIFKSNQVAFWSDSLVQLNKLRKFKFSRLIHNILSTKDCSPVVIYQNGSIGILRNEMISRKIVTEEQEIFEDNEEILSSSLVLISGQVYVNLLTIKKNNVKRLHFIPIDTDRGDRFSLNLEENCSGSFNTHTVIQGEITFLITLWSDGSLYSFDLPVKDVKFFPGRILSKVESVNLHQQAIMQSMGEQQVVIYGAAPNSEGAVLCVFNLKYGLIDSVQNLKVYTDDPKLWVVGAASTNRYILCLSGGHLVVIPTRFVTQRLCSLVGVAKLNEIDNTALPVVKASWKSCDEIEAPIKMDLEYQEELTAQILTMREDGFTDHMICEELLPKLIENVEEEKIFEVLSLVNDVPDNWLIDLAIKYNKKVHSEVLLEKVLKRPLVSDNTSLHLVRSRINLPKALELLGEISKMMDKHPLDKSLVDWACLLLDSHYQQYLLSKDETVIKTIQEINTILKLHMDCMENTKSLNALLLSLKKGHIYSKKSSVSPHSYQVDTIKLY